jgi:hypothetical protein
MNRDEKEDESYAYWRVSLMQPQPRTCCSIVLVERADRFINSRAISFYDAVPHIAVASRPEVQGLFETLSVFDAPLHGDPQLFLSVMHE